MYSNASSAAMDVFSLLRRGLSGDVCESLSFAPLREALGLRDMYLCRWELLHTHHMHQLNSLPGHSGLLM